MKKLLIVCFIMLSSGFLFSNEVVIKTQKYQIVQVKVGEYGYQAVLMIDTEDGRTWRFIVSDDFVGWQPNGVIVPKDE